MTRQAIIYRRVSSARQSDEGKSLEDQDSALVDYCRAMRWEVIGNFQDAVSGRREKTDKRTGLASALEMVCQHKATLVVHDLDRLARSQSVGMRIVEQIQDCGAYLVIKGLGIDTTTPAGEMIVGIMFAVAQWGSRNIGSGVKRANDGTVKRLGYRTMGQQAYGYIVTNGERVPVPAEQEAIAQILALRDDDVKYADIAAILNAQGLKRRNGYAWYGANVLRVIERARGVRHR